MRHLDEAMVSITTGEVSPIATGIIYCAVIDACVGAQDLRRAAEWTDAVSVLVRQRARRRAVPRPVPRPPLADPDGARATGTTPAPKRSAPVPSSPTSATQRSGTPCTSRGSCTGCGVTSIGPSSPTVRPAVRGVSRTPASACCGWPRATSTTPRASARRMLDETRTSLDRPAILAAVVEVLIAAGALDEAMTACDELDRCAAQGAELLRAMASKSRASLLHARGDDHGAAVAVRGALVSWRQLDMPFEEARTRALAARILTAVGDRDAAELERQSAQVTFERLAACTELADLRRGTPSPVAPLTDRECEVLRLVAVGSTNRDIADALVISEHTVARHMQNIFAKLGVSSRAAATVWADQYRLSCERAARGQEVRRCRQRRKWCPRAMPGAPRDPYRRDD